MKRLVRIAFALVTAGLAGVFAMGLWSRSRMLDAAGVEAALLALPANRPFQVVGLQHRAFDFDAGGETIRAELTWCHVPRADGAPPARPIVLVHGTPDALVAWEGVIFGAGGVGGRGHDVYAFDVLGHGTTRTVVSPCTFQRCADWVALAIGALGLRDVCLVGQSYGGEFVWRAALDHPDLIGRVVLIDSSGLPRPAGGWLSEEVQMRENPLADVGWVLNSRDRVRSALDPHFADRAPHAGVDDFVICCSRPTNWRAMVDLVRDENGARANELPHLTQPVLLLWGSRDLAYPVAEFGSRFADRIPNARLEIVPDAGHYPHVEQAAVVADAILEFA